MNNKTAQFKIHCKAVESKIPLSLSQIFHTPHIFSDLLEVTTSEVQLHDSTAFTVSF